MDALGQQIFEFISHYGYWVILPLMIIEGPTATIIGATLAALGAFNVWVILGLSVLGDVLGDILFYAAGYFWGMKFVKKVGKYIGITEKMVLKMEKYFQNHGGKTIVTVKAMTGLCWVTFTTAGIVRMNFGKFVKYSAIGGIFWSGALVILGYFYGYMWREISEYVEWAGWIAVGLGLGTLFIVNIFKSQKSKKIFDGSLFNKS